MYISNPAGPFKAPSRCHISYTSTIIIDSLSILYTHHSEVLNFPRVFLYLGIWVLKSIVLSGDKIKKSHGAKLNEMKKGTKNSVIIGYCGLLRPTIRPNLNKISISLKSKYLNKTLFWKTRKRINHQSKSIGTKRMCDRIVVEENHIRFNSVQLSYVQNLSPFCNRLDKLFIEQIQIAGQKHNITVKLVFQEKREKHRQRLEFYVYPIPSNTSNNITSDDFPEGISVMYRKHI
ncbi:hypothetical protein AGLY_006201 [Aphis glycines]|uniref:Uncharacterized protein n=1 Tax=Aphis glycines TaxID=307491 RepID=A0A6G0TUC8_APHGL|nr:hypothetical protein AGLY_006201 [Aphis glycines]